jgi:phage-related protein
MTSLLSDLQAIGNVGGLFTQGSTLSLGSVTFTGQEIPDYIEMGGQQAIALKKYIGGLRDIQVMGRDDQPLTWTGIMLGPNAEARMLLLDAMRTAGLPVSLYFGTMSYTVVVTEFKGKYKRTNWCEYSITCTVQADNATPATKLSSPLNSLVGSSLGSAISGVTSAVDSVANTISQVASVAQNIVQTAESAIAPVASVFGISVYSDMQGISNALDGAQSVAGGLSAIANAPSAIASTITSMQTAGSQILSTMSSAESTMEAVAGRSPLNGIVGGVSDLFSAITSSTVISSLTSAAGYLNQAGANLVLSAPGGAVGAQIASAQGTNPGPFSYGGYSFGPETIVPLSQVA